MPRIASSPSVPRSPCRRSASDFFPMSARRFPLARAPGFVGTHLALTGNRIGAADAIYCGLGRHSYCRSEAGRASRRRSRIAAPPIDVRARLGGMSTPPAPGDLPAARPWIDRCYGAERCRRDCRAPARQRRRRRARAALETMRRRRRPRSRSRCATCVRRHHSSALRNASSRITVSRWRALPGMISSKAFARPSSTRTAIRSGVRTSLKR